MDISILYLSWKKRNILEKTLKSHKENGLFDYIPSDKRIIFFQQIHPNDIKLAEKYGCKYIGNKNNVGILNAYIELVNNCTTKYFIYCENDFVLLENNHNIKNILNDAISIIDNNKFSKIKLSNIKNPGFLYIKPDKDWFEKEQENFNFKAESLSWINDPYKVYKNLKHIQLNYKWFIFNLKEQNWSNHIHMCDTDTIKKNILPLLIHNRDNNEKLDVRYQGLEDTIINLDDIPNKNNVIIELINNVKKYKIYCGGGNFYHNKLNNI